MELSPYRGVDVIQDLLEIKKKVELSTSILDPEAYKSLAALAFKERTLLLQSFAAYSTYVQILLLLLRKPKHCLPFE